MKGFIYSVLNIITHSIQFVKDFLKNGFAERFYGRSKKKKEGGAEKSSIMYRRINGDPQKCPLFCKER